MLVKQNKDQKVYLLALKSDVTDFLVNFKKRFRLFPWSKVNKVMRKEYSTVIVVNGAKFTVKSLVQEINKTKTKLNSKLRPSAFNPILKGYIKDAKNLEGKELKRIYQNYKDELQKEFKSMRMDLEFCLSALKALNKYIKEYESPVHESAFLYEDENSPITKTWEWVKRFGRPVIESASVKDLDLSGIDTIIFDFGSVLIKGDHPEDHVREKLEGKISNEDLILLTKVYYDSIKDHETVTIEDAIRLYEMALPERLRKHAKLVYETMASSIVAYDYTVPVLQNLKEAGYELYYLSNWDKSGFELCKKNGKFDFIKYFKDGIVSYEVGLTKPNEEIYQLLIDKFNINPKKAIFFDDKQENIKAAEKVGLNAVVFTQNTVSEVMNMGKFVKESASKSGTSRAEIVDKIEKILIDKGYEPKITKKSREKWISGENTDFGNSLCFAGLGKDTVKVAKEVRAELSDAEKNQYNFTDDNYGCCFLCCVKEDKKEEVPSEGDEPKTEEEPKEEEVKESADMDFFLEYFALDDDDDILTEGANIDNSKTFIQMKKDIKSKTKEMKVNIKAQKFAEAKKCVKDIETIIDKAKKTIEKTEGDTSSAVLGALANILIFNAKSIIVNLPAAAAQSVYLTKVMSSNTFAVLSPNALEATIFSLTPVANVIAVINELIKFVEDIVTISNNVKKADTVTADDFNLFKARLMNKCDDLKKIVKKFNALIDKEETKAKNKEKEVKESAVDEKKLAIYESCSKGEITIEEREALLRDLYVNDMVTTESANISDDISLSEKYDEVRKIIYERCNDGFISVEEREALLAKAYDDMFAENTNQELPDDPKVEQEQQKVEKDLEKQIDDATKKPME